MPANGRWDLIRRLKVNVNVVDQTWRSQKYVKESQLDPAHGIAMYEGGAER